MTKIMACFTFCQNLLRERMIVAFLLIDLPVQFFFIQKMLLIIRHRKANKQCGDADQTFTQHLGKSGSVDIHSF